MLLTSARSYCPTCLPPCWHWCHGCRWDCWVKWMWVDIHCVGIKLCVSFAWGASVRCLRLLRPYTNPMQACWPPLCMLQISKTASQNIGLGALAVAATAVAGLAIHAAFLALNASMCW